VRLGFRTKLVLTLAGLFVLLMAILLGVDLYNERRSIDEIEGTMEAVTKAIEVSSEQLNYPGAIDEEVLEDYVQKLRARGVQGIEVLNPERQVIASSYPRPAQKGDKRKPRGLGDIAITGRIDTGEGARLSAPRVYPLTMPIISQNHLVGYVHLDLVLDDYQALLHRNSLRRVIVVLAVLALGVIVVLLLAGNVSRPIALLTGAAEKVAGGALDADIPVHRDDDVGQLLKTWNGMLARLREQRRLEQRLAQAERSAAVGHLASGIAHEIRNPLNTISLAVDYLKKRFHPADQKSAEEFERTSESIRAEIGRLNNLITNFLSFGKPLTLRPVDTDVADFLDRIIQEVRPEAEARKIAVLWGRSNEAPHAALDHDLARSAFLNVIINAFQAIGENGSLAVTIAGYGTGEDAVRIVFEDSGPGIPGDNLARIFEPYFSTKDTGIGLGLAMVRKIIEDHGGRVQAENRSEGGSRFTIVLPAARILAEAGIPPAGAADSGRA
jgi:signal transduction histidine kinase